MPLMYDPESPISSTSSQRCSHFVIAPASVEDVRRLVDIEFHAFENERANQQLSYRDYSKPEHFERTVEIYTKSMKEEEQHSAKLSHRSQSRRRSKASSMSSRVTFLKVTDVDNDEIVSFAKFEVKAYSVDELDTPADTGHEKEQQMNRDWFALNERLRREYLGLERHCYLGMLATRPCYQHHGAGTMLLNAVLDEADRAGAKVYLEATNTAKPLYEKHRFVQVNEIRFEPARYGVFDLGTETQTVMVRGNIDEDGERTEVMSWDLAVAQAEAGVQNATGSEHWVATRRV